LVFGKGIISKGYFTYCTSKTIVKRAKMKLNCMCFKFGKKKKKKAGKKKNKNSFLFRKKRKTNQTFYEKIFIEEQCSIKKD